MRVFRCFLNDDDGLSITDTLALFFSLIYLVIIVVMLYCLIKNRLTENHLDFMQISTWPALTILGGYFGDRIFSNFGPVGSARRARRVSTGGCTSAVACDADEEIIRAGSDDRPPL